MSCVLYSLIQRLVKSIKKTTFQSFLRALEDYLSSALFPKQQMLIVLFRGKSLSCAPWSLGKSSPRWGWDWKWPFFSWFNRTRVFWSFEYVAKAGGAEGFVLGSRDANRPARLLTSPYLLKTEVHVLLQACEGVWENQRETKQCRENEHWCHHSLLHQDSHVRVTWSSKVPKCPDIQRVKP